MSIWYWILNTEDIIGNCYQVYGPTCISIQIVLWKGNIWEILRLSILSFMVYWQKKVLGHWGNRKVNETFGPLLVTRARRRRVQPLWWNCPWFNVITNGITLFCVWNLNFVYDLNVVLVVLYHIISLHVSIQNFYMRLLCVHNVQYKSYFWRCVVCVFMSSSKQLAPWQKECSWTFLYVLYLAQSLAHDSCSLLSFEWKKKRMSYCQATFLSTL